MEITETLNHRRVCIFWCFSMAKARPGQARPGQPGQAKPGQARERTGLHFELILGSKNLSDFISIFTSKIDAKMAPKWEGTLRIGLQEAPRPGQDYIFHTRQIDVM